MTARDLIRQIVVISAFCFMVVGAMYGVGLFGGTPVEDVQGGALDEDGSFLAPASQAFRIWSVIYLGLAAYTVWQALPGQRADERQRTLGWLIAGTMVLNGLWLVAAQLTTLPLTVLTIVVLLVLLAVTYRRARKVPARGRADLLLVDGVTGLHLGWVTLATFANTAAWLTSSRIAGWADAGETWAVVTLVVVAVLGLALGVVGRWFLAPALAIAWGLCWLAVGRLAGEPHSTLVGTTAIVVAIVVLGVTVAARVRRRAVRA